jgi:hypothetical protein
VLSPGCTFLIISAMPPRIFEQALGPVLAGTPIVEEIKVGGHSGEIDHR